MLTTGTTLNHQIKNNQNLTIEKLIPKELYSLSIVLKNKLPMSKKYFSNIFSDYRLNGKRFIFY